MSELEWEATETGEKAIEVLDPEDPFGFSIQYEHWQTPLGIKFQASLFYDEEEMLPILIERTSEFFTCGYIPDREGAALRTRAAMKKKIEKLLKKLARAERLLAGVNDV